MPQTAASTPLQVILTPMQLPTAVPFDAATQRSLHTLEQMTGIRPVHYPGDPADLLARLQPQSLTAQPEQRLLLQPGEMGELVVQLYNQSDRPLQVQVRVDGNFPRSWLQIEGETPRQVLNTQVRSRQQAETTLRFCPSADFFERQAPLPLEGRLTLDYTCRLRVTCQPVEAPVADTTQSLIWVETYTIALHLRPRSLYLDFLPNIYRETDFSGRFLAIFEQAFEPVVQTMDAMAAHLDPLTAPEALLPFLAYWVGCPVNPQWSVAKQRRLIRQAIALYQWRGTKRGLRLYLHLYTDLPLGDDIPNEADKPISITELASTGFVLDDSDLGEGAMLGGGRPFHFIVRLRQQSPDQAIDEAVVRQIIEREKPAFCTYELIIETL